MKYQLDDQVVLISGGSQGLGRAYAKKYIQDSNSTVIIVSRSKAKLQKAAEGITGEGSFCELEDYTEDCRLVYCSCDLSVYDSVAEMFKLLESKQIKVTQVLFCAGGAVPKLFKDLSGAELLAGVTMNYSTAVYLAHASLRHGARHLVLFSSSAGAYPFIGYGQYAPLKAAIRSLVAILRQEHPEARISCIYPGNFASEGYEEESRTKPAITSIIEGSSHAISCDECCDKIIRSLKSGYDDIPTDFVGWLLLACSMGFNVHSTTYFLWPLGWILGAIANLIVVPIYMIMCSWDIKKWMRKQDQVKNGHSETKSD
ncbi:HBR391Cp [Eremothecium sinecaudum]|uniref:3-ketodihydrosphingosine reductase TSC10 n=1 Tax=Eremothecium sinecaudum TaxID=45286 RepID=A0A120K1E4_9SACH|nr:HBR391Cp [Eremothecium sinecaudum]AMD19292.1 HBR391Cp [Eremothecium sinecaudum]